MVVHSPDLLLRNRSALPGLEDPLQLRFDLSQGRVPHHDQGGVVGPVPGGVEILELVPGDGFGRLFRSGPGQRVPVGVVRSVDELWHHPQGHADGADLLPLDPGQELAPEPLQLLFREGRVQHHVGVEIQRLGEVRLERRQGDRRVVERSAAADVGPETALPR